MSALVRACRPKQWLKNVLVLAAPGAAGVLDNGESILRVLIAFVALSAAASGTYVWNDVLDVEADRRHPTKCRRPIAAGEVSLSSAKVWGSFLLVAGIALGLVPDWRCGVAVAVYVVLTTTYSTFLKHRAVLDLMAVASGFVLRAIAGAEATNVEMSNWFLLCVSFAALFIVSGKRFAEMREMGAGNGSTRSILSEYTPEYLRTVLSVNLTAAAVTYCLWAFDTKELSGSSWPFYELSIVPMLAALFRYLLALDQGRGSAPEEIFLADRTMQVLGVLWAVVFGLGVYVS
ncbi:MAG: decaprenyl-phosphate phosphoribosyltransferase [Ilumatobacteraceae bacterium]